MCGHLCIKYIDSAVPTFSMLRRNGRSPKASAKVWKLKSSEGGWAKDTPMLLMPGGCPGEV